jgi:hypothetical protein
MSKFFDLLKNEERRLLNGPLNDEKIGGLGTNRFIIFCNGNAQLILQRSKEVLLKVNRVFQKRVPNEKEWYSLLPDYFVYRCKPEIPRTQAKKEQNLDRKISQYISSEEYEIWNNMAQWNLLSWIYWYQEENRYWYWWDAYVHEDSHIFLAVEVHEWPYPSENLSWLFRGCGACYVQSEA